jgi:p24 family protein alpha
MVTNELNIHFTVEETFDNDHRVVTQTTQSSTSPSKFTFSAADSGMHRLCFTPSGPAAVSVNGWFGGQGNVLGGVKLSVDMVIGETSKIESEDKGKIDTMVGKVRELNGRLQDIRREQVFQRVRAVPPPAITACCIRQDPRTNAHPYSRNEKPNFAIRVKPSTRVSCAGV